jgi:hypothetical protein
MINEQEAIEAVARTIAPYTLLTADDQDVAIKAIEASGYKAFYDKMQWQPIETHD